MNNTPQTIDQEHTLTALKILENNSAATQRELSRRMNMSLGKVNFLIRSMVEHGLVKARRFTNSRNKRAYLYVLTPKGLERKIFLTRNFLIRKITEYEQLKAEIERLQNDLSELDTVAASNSATTPERADESHGEP